MVVMLQKLNIWGDVCCVMLLLVSVVLLLLLLLLMFEVISNKVGAAPKAALQKWIEDTI